MAMAFTFCASPTQETRQATSRGQSGDGCEQLWPIAAGHEQCRVWGKAGGDAIARASKQGRHWHKNAGDKGVAKTKAGDWGKQSLRPSGGGASSLGTSATSGDDNNMPPHITRARTDVI